MRLIFAFALIGILGGCASTFEQSRGCAVYTQLKSYEPPFSGLIYLYDDLEKVLISQVPQGSRKDEFCWYARGEDIIGASQHVVKGWSKTFTFKLVEGNWVLQEEKETFQRTAHG